MTTDIAIASPASDLTSQMEFAKMLSTGDMLPAEYKGKPGNALIAIGLGQSMGLSPAESLYRIQVIKGKPTASAELIASNVRKAGHRLRVETDDVSATATIWRNDDPDFAHVVRRDKKWADQMGVSSQDNYRKQPVTMYANRAITACARLACPEALYGVAYVPEEMSDFRPEPAAVTAPRVADVKPLASAEQVAEIKAGVQKLGLAKTEAADLIHDATGRDGARTDNLTPGEAELVLRVMNELLANMAAIDAPADDEGLIPWEPAEAAS